MATLPYLRRLLIEKAGRFPNVDRWGAAMLERPAVAEGMTVGVARAETIEGGLTGFTDEHRAILWGDRQHRSEEHTSELQSLMRSSYAVFCLKKTTKHRT